MYLEKRTDYMQNNNDYLALNLKSGPSLVGFCKYVHKQYYPLLNACFFKMILWPPPKMEALLCVLTVHPNLPLSHAEEGAPVSD